MSENGSTIAQKISALKQQKLCIQQWHKERMIGKHLAKIQSDVLEEIIKDYEELAERGVLWEGTQSISQIEE